MKGYGISIENELLEEKHVQQMGIAVWLFMWLIDKMTSISEEGIGLVLGGKPVKYEEVKKDLGMSIATYRRWVAVLEEMQYIQVNHAPYGIIFRVNKAKKRFSKRGVSDVTHQSIKSDTPEIINDTPNKTIQYDNTVDILDEKKSRPISQTVKKEPSEEQKMYQRIVGHLEETLDMKVTNWGKQGKAIKDMLKAGYTELQITKTIDYMAHKDEFYADKGFDMTTVAKQIPLYKARMRKVAQI